MAMPVQPLPDSQVRCGFVQVNAIFVQFIVDIGVVNVLKVEGTLSMRKAKGITTHSKSILDESEAILYE